METPVIYSDFGTLRRAYIEVKKFIAQEVGVKDFSLKTTLVNDLGCAGDDNLELLEKFIRAYHLDSTGFNYQKHFLSEGELFHSGTTLLTILLVLILLMLWIVKIITFNKIDFTNSRLLPDIHRPTLDMTFGDMLTWYLTEKYNLRAEVKFKLKPAV